jgi:HSP20 family protein
MPCDPLRDLRAWQERLERLTTQGGSAWDPPIDVYETASRYVITAEVPGLARDQIDLAVQDNRLSIKGVRPGAGPETPTQHYHQVERGHGSFLRTFEFVDAVDQDGITADLRDGVLTVTLPKIVHPPRRIEVQ